MKTAVVTVTIGVKFEEMSKLTHPSIKIYADKIGAEFIVLNKQSQLSPTPHFEKFQLYYLLNKYDRIIYLDTDLILRKDCPNLFDIVPESKFGAFNEGAFCERAQAFQMAQQQHKIFIRNWNGKYFNSGVMVISRMHKFLFKLPENTDLNFYEQSYLNLMLHSNQVEIFDLDSNFNRMSCIDSKTGLHRLNSYIVHYAGAPDSMDVNQIIRADLEIWEKDNYPRKRNILYRPQGGLGDVICSEPTARHLLNTMYKDTNFVIETWFPRVFSHLPCRVFKVGQFQPERDIPYYVINSMTPPEHISWQFMSVNLMHTIDFSSLISCRKILPDNEKNIKLVVSLEDIKEITEIIGITSLIDFVLIHPGKGWPSKTFPNNFWSDIIDGLVKANKKVILIGKYVSGEQGVTDIKFDHENVLDLRNLTSLGGLIGLISQAKILISNDSAPIHIAGAFDNDIILIPTCKHPDWCLPYRNGNKYYKSQALYKKALWDTYDSAPTNINGEAIDRVNGNYEDYLPDPQTVIDVVIKIG